MYVPVMGNLCSFYVLSYPKLDLEGNQTCLLQCNAAVQGNIAYFRLNLLMSKLCGHGSTDKLMANSRQKLLKASESQWDLCAVWWKITQTKGFIFIPIKITMGSFLPFLFFLYLDWIHSFVNF